MNLTPKDYYDWNTNVIGEDGKIQFCLILERNCEDNFISIFNAMEDKQYYLLREYEQTEISNPMFQNWLHAKFGVTTKNSTFGLVTELYRYWKLETEPEKDGWLFIRQFDRNLDIWMGDKLIRYLKSLNRKIIVTTYQHLYTTNNLLRPDCCFIPWNGKLEQLADRTDRTLREGNNVPKLYRANEFFGDW